MIPLLWFGAAIYTVVGIGYAKTLNRLMKDTDADFVLGVFMVVLWPLFLIVAAFWNFDND